MSKITITVAGVIIWTATTIAQVPAAQQPPTAGDPTRNPAATQPPTTASKITLQGCMERQGSTTGTSGAVGTAGSAGSFILTKAERQPAASGAAARPADSASAPMTMTYRLDADAAKLTPHVGHKVEVTGTMEAASGARPQAGSTQPPSAGTTAPTFKVDEVKMLAASCTE